MAVRCARYRLREVATGSESSIRCLKNFESFASSGLGVRGRPKLMSNAVGGDAVVSSVSSRLLPALQPSSDVVKFVKAALVRHLKLYKDGGWSTAVLSARLILDALNTGVPRHLSSEIYDLLSSKCLELLTSFKFKSKLTLDLNSVDHFMGIVNGIVNPKSSNFGMSQTGINDFKGKIIEYFLNYKSHYNIGNFASSHCIVNLGILPAKVYLVDGVVLEMNDLSCQSDFQEVQTGNDLSVAMYGCSLTNHNYNELGAVVETDDKWTIEEASLSVILDLMEHLVNGVKVDILLCQKVIHPKVKCLLRERGVAVAERIGLEKMKAIHFEVGGTMASSFTQPLADPDLGRVKEIRLEKLRDSSDRCCLRIVGKRKTGCLVMDAMSRESSDEMLHVFDAGILALKTAVETGGALLLGRGCWQREMVEMIAGEAAVLSGWWSQQLECNPGQVDAVVEAVCRSLRGLHRIIDPREGVIPEGGDFSEEHPLFDLQAQVTSCLQTAFFLASTVLRTADFF